MRIEGRKALSLIIKNPKNIRIIESYIFKNYYSTYNDHIYEFIGEIILKKSIKETFENLKRQRTLWNNSIFDEIKDKIDLQNELIDGCVVEEGILQCTKCSSKRIKSFSKQIRSGDEGFTVLAQCSNCKANWSIS